MKSYLFIFLLLLSGFSLLAQAPTISSLTVTGDNIKWYNASTGGTQYTSPATTTLVNGQIYYASQTVNGVESTTRVSVTANLTIVAAPATGTHTPAQTQVIWNWNPVSGAAGYKWSAANVYSGATDLGNVLTSTETGLSCNTAYSRYIWSYNGSGCVSAATTLSQTTSSCVNLPTLSTTAITQVYSNSCLSGGNITNDGGGTISARGVCWSTSVNPNITYHPRTLDGSGTGAFSSSLTNLTPFTTYHVRAYATNSAGTGYGPDLTVTTMNGITFYYTGAYESWTVPAGVTSIIIEAWGADGGGGSGFQGMGGYTKGSLAVSAGTTYYIYVGEKPTAQAGGWNGGGTGGLGGASSNYDGFGGGGATDVRTTAGNLSSRILVAGGSGGINELVAWLSMGSGGGTTGGKAPDQQDGKGGFGGTQSAGGAAGSSLRNATAGALGIGGNGSGGYPKAMGGGGGGGGYYGGGGSSSTGDVYLSNTGWAVGGGGGSSYISPSFTETSNLQGVRLGDGMLRIHY